MTNELSIAELCQNPVAHVTDAEAAEILGVSQATLRRWRDAGRLNFFKRGCHIVYVLADVVKYAEGNKRKKYTRREPPDGAQSTG